MVSTETVLASGPVLPDATSASISSRLLQLFLDVADNRVGLTHPIGAVLAVYTPVAAALALISIMACAFFGMPELIAALANAQVSGVASLPSDFGLIQCADVQPAPLNMSTRFIIVRDALTVSLDQSRKVFRFLC